MIKKYQLFLFLGLLGGGIAHGVMFVPYTSGLAPDTEDIKVLFSSPTKADVIFDFIDLKATAGSDSYNQAIATFMEDTGYKINVTPSSYAKAILVGKTPVFILGVGFVRGQELYDLFEAKGKSLDMAWIHLDELIKGLTPYKVDQATRNNEPFVTIKTTTKYHTLFKISLQTAQALRGELLEQLKKARQNVRDKVKAQNNANDTELDTFLNITLTDLVQNKYTKDQVKKMYHKLVMKYHPDKNPLGGETTKKQFEETTKQLTIHWNELNNYSK
ncbi:hypothetical protein A3F06_01030 [candidate division TM6 bacterium RIFCSPHIGHO2_12_FULL_36_22]|nr:MAG: hypothetical protein A3F06_01030 [candidate division TM6 bacterium RIFCSPHIGHO2_12_FULL_36_22]